MRLADFLTIIEMLVGLRVREVRNPRLLLKHHHTIRPSESKVRNFISLLDGLSKQFRVHNNRGHDSHTNRQDGNSTQVLAVNDDDSAGLQELVAGRVGCVDCEIRLLVSVYQKKTTREEKL